MKLVITGGLRRNIGEAFFKKKLTRRCPCPKASAYVEAFKKCNRKAFLRIEASAVRPVRKMSYGKKKLPNGRHFLTKTLDQWLLPATQLCFTKREKADGSLLVERHHFDGSPSIFHLGLGTAGRRDLVCDQAAAEPQVVLKNVPGTVYLGQLTGPKHQVFHQPCPDDELIDATGFGPTSCTLMCRTALFPHTQSRRMNGWVHTPELFAVMQQAFTAGLRQNAFRLPTLAECIEAEGKLHLTLPSQRKFTSKKRKKAAVANLDADAQAAPSSAPVAGPIPTRRMRVKASFPGVYAD